MSSYRLLLILQGSPLSTTTRISTSLREPASPRATEPYRVTDSTPSEFQATSNETRRTATIAIDEGGGNPPDERRSLVASFTTSDLFLKRPDFTSALTPLTSSGGNLVGTTRLMRIRLYTSDLNNPIRLAVSTVLILRLDRGLYHEDNGASNRRAGPEALMLLGWSRKAGLVKNGSSGQTFETHGFCRRPRKVTIVSVHLPDS